jgi:cobalt transporter subunit CbtB
LQNGGIEVKEHRRKKAEAHMVATVRILGDEWIFAGFLLLGLFALYVVALDQGFLLSLFQGPAAFDMNLIHEAVHDARHAAGYPCH